MKTLKAIFPYLRWLARLVWWGILLSAITYYLYCRLPSLRDGAATSADVIIFFVWIVVALLPLIVEINFFGIQLKRHIDELRDEVKEEISTLRAEIQNNNTNKNQLNQNLVVSPGPPPDSQLKDLEHRFTQVVERALRSVGAPSPQNQAPVISRVDDKVALLFSARYQIEKELRRIWTTRFQDQGRRPVPAISIATSLVNGELIPADFAHAIRDVYAVCTPAIHGEDISDAKLDFVRDLAPKIIATLKEIK